MVCKSGSGGGPPLRRYELTIHTPFSAGDRSEQLQTMSTREKLIEARISMLALADELQNISRACKVAGISRSHFYEIKEAFEKYGRDGLAPQPRRRPRMPNQTPSEFEGMTAAEVAWMISAPQSYYFGHP